MLKALSLSNFVLIDKAYITFKKGFTAITGETGAGKTMVLHALKLLLGETVKTDVICSGKDEAVIVGAFDISSIPEIYSVLDDAGISFTKDDDLVVRRRLSRNGNNRTFINGQIASLPLLKKLGMHLFEIASQHQASTLHSPLFQIETLDRYAALKETKEAHKVHYARERMLSKEYKALLEEKNIAEKTISLCEFQLEEITACELGEDEDIDALFEQFKTLSDQESSRETIQALKNTLTVALESFVPLQKDIHLVPELKLAIEQLHQAEYALDQKTLSYDTGDNFLSTLEARLSLIETCQRKYGDLHKEEIRLKEKLEYYTFIDQKIDAKHQELVDATEKRTSVSKKLTLGRKKAANQFAQAVATSLKKLGMQALQFEIQITQVEPSDNGCDLVTFLLAPNKGSTLAPLKNSASGGECARLLFVIKTLLSQKGTQKSLIFDEIDASIGGTVATQIGQDLKTMGTSRQVIAISHFPQVARFANHHLLMQKVEHGEKAVTKIEYLDIDAIQLELLRMSGKTDIGHHSQNKSLTCP